MELSPEKKIAGILAPLFGLRSENDLGIGDVLDPDVAGCVHDGGTHQLFTSGACAYSSSVPTTGSTVEVTTELVVAVPTPSAPPSHLSP